MRLRKQSHTRVFRGSTVEVTLLATSLLVACTECVCVRPHRLSMATVCVWVQAFSRGASAVKIIIIVTDFSCRKYIRRLIDINNNDNTRLQVCYNYSILLLF